MGSRACLNIAEEENISCSWWELNHSLRQNLFDEYSYDESANLCRQTILNIFM